MRRLSRFRVRVAELRISRKISVRGLRRPGTFGKFCRWCGSAEGGLMLRSSILAALAVVLVANVAGAQDKVAKGAQVYADQKCSLCHSIAGKGNAKGPLDEVGSKLSAADLKAWIVDAKGMTAKTKATRKPDMKNYTLPDADVDALVAYMATLKKK